MRVALLGGGTVGADLLIRLGRTNGIELGPVVDTDTAAPGTVIARREGLAVAAGGVDAVLAAHPAPELVFVALNAVAADHAVPKLLESGVRVVNLTPAATGTAVVPEVNLDAAAEAVVIDIVAAGGQASVPLVAALAAVAEIEYAEVVSTIASTALGNGARRDLDAMLASTASSLRVVGGARAAKSALIVSPADPPAIMRNRLSCLAERGADRATLAVALQDAVLAASRRVPGFRAASEPTFEQDPDGRLRVELVSDIEAGRPLLEHQGNVELITAAARSVAELLAAPDQMAAT